MFHHEWHQTVFTIHVSRLACTVNVSRPVLSTRVSRFAFIIVSRLVVTDIIRLISTVSTRFTLVSVDVVTTNASRLFTTHDSRLVFNTRVSRRVVTTVSTLVSIIRYIPPIPVYFVVATCRSEGRSS